MLQEIPLVVCQAPPMYYSPVMHGAALPDILVQELKGVHGRDAYGDNTLDTKDGTTHVLQIVAAFQ